ncbi:MAG: hydrogenase formation protein HypD [Nitrospinae bacterium]|nr:hydrogenase formation protein HypD [Nitrospinota bacterium]
MKYIDEFRDKGLIYRIINQIKREANDLDTLTIMEVCGTHTMSSYRYGIRELLPSNIRLVSGPGCPVCVSPITYIDKSIAFSDKKDIIITTFGDMFRVPGSVSSLEREKAKGKDIRIVYSPMDSLEIAKQNGDRKVLFLGIGFETTAPLVAATIIQANREGIRNYLVLSSHKTIPEPMQVLLDDNGLEIHGFLCPGHVSTIIGSLPYQFIPDRYKISCVIAGFEPFDILKAILMVIRQVKSKRFSVEIEYSRVVKPEGNRVALRYINEVFERCDAEWRGLGTIPKSGLRIREVYKRFDAEKEIYIEIKEGKGVKGCLCGDILKGKIEPYECSLFSIQCIPDNPLGPCMVSSEGTCAAYYRFSVK